MKKSGSTIVFVLVCVGVLVAAFAIGSWIREIRFSGAENESETATVPKKSPSELERQQEQARRMPGSGGMDRGSDLSSPEDRAALVEQRAGMKEGFENMSEEEQEKFKAQMRDRFGGRRRDTGPQLSEEDRTKMREEMEELRAKWEEMSEAEREEARNQISEKYGVTPRGLGGGRSFGDGESGRRRPGADDGGAPPPKGRACFVAETPVWIDGKILQISRVTAGQTVGKQFYGAPSLEQVQEHEGTFECLDIVLESGHTIGVIDAHCFMLDSGQWIAAPNLTSGLRLKTLTGTVGIKSVTKRAVPYTGKVYNLKVQSSDQYIVGKDGVIVRDY